MIVGWFYGMSTYDALFMPNQIENEFPIYYFTMENVFWQSHLTDNHVILSCNINISLEPMY